MKPLVLYRFHRTGGSAQQVKFGDLSMEDVKEIFMAQRQCLVN